MNITNWLLNCKVTTNLAKASGNDLPLLSAEYNGKQVFYVPALDVFPHGYGDLDVAINTMKALGNILKVTD